MSPKTVEIKVFSLFLLNNRRIQIRTQDAQKHVDPVDPDSDPQHCTQQMDGDFAAGFYLSEAPLPS